MAGIALLSDLLRRSTTATGGGSAKSLYSHGLLSATVTASIAGFSASRVLLGDGIPVAFCDAGVEWKDDFFPDWRGISKSSPYRDALNHSTKVYAVELKPLFSAFGLKSFAITSLRSFLMFYLPLLEPRTPVDEDDDILQDSEDTPVDLVVPFKKSVKQIARETSVITTRRLLERLAVHYVSQRMAWKLLKDIPRSAKRKAGRGMPTSIFFYSVSRSTFRGHLLGVAAAWLVQIGIETYRCFFSKTDEDVEDTDGVQKVRLIGKKVSDTTIKCCTSLIFASVGAGVGALFHPSIGQWIGCAIGDFAGPVVIAVCFEQFLHYTI